MDLLLNTVQTYDWGSRTLLPELMGVPPTGAPQAELWMGAHPAAPSRVSRGDAVVPLDRVVSGDPEGELGAVTVRRFGSRLPFLLKLLAADTPLSVQVHPDLAQAQAGFARENALGVPLDAPHRNYRDDQHKPEMIVALTQFRGLCGFRNPSHTADLFDSLEVHALQPYAETLRVVPERQALAEVFRAFLRPPAGLLDAVAQALAAAAAGTTEARLAAYARIARTHPGDPGLLSALMLRYVELSPGEALFLGAGVPHAYLSGLGVEIMASSDNVLRCGLTSKHVDTEELARVVRFDAPPARVLTPREEGGEEVYPAPVDDFRLSRCRLHAGERRRARLDAPQILLCVRGSMTVSLAGESISIGPGQAVYVSAGAEAVLGGAGTAFRATTGTAGFR
ncbi:mannose-6-phosphate isomerase, class I [Streptomyces flavochromogenes]|uniref:mannose-6-phosphate isomerase, class I n=1 Tax=Streptomyces flavochromogenes TaxID=68199 RepID=UPI0004C25DA3|nr:mannose-6-phosphate isomerase, class I [Streptomyces flavochromogenes]